MGTLVVKSHFFADCPTTTKAEGPQTYFARRVVGETIWLHKYSHFLNISIQGVFFKILIVLLNRVL